MEELKQLAELQGGVLYVEQVEEWVEKVVEELELRRKVAESELSINLSKDIWRNAIEIVKDGGRCIRLDEVDEFLKLRGVK